MTHEIVPAHEDPRPIRRLDYHDGEHSWQVGSGSTTAITAYAEPGLHANLSFYAVMAGETVMARVPATSVTAIYGPEVCDG